MPQMTSWGTIQFQYFKGFDSASLSLAQPVTVLIGRNGAGKSNIMEGIGLLGELGSGRPLFEVSDGGRWAIRGGLEGCPSLGERWFILAYEQDSLRYKLVVRPDVQQVEAESLWIQNSILFQVIEEQVNFKNRILHVRYKRAPGAPPEEDLIEALSAERTVLSVYPHNFSLRPLAAVEELKRRLRGIRVLAAQPAAMRKYHTVGLSLGRRPIAPDAANLSAVLHDLHTGSEQDRALLKSICNELHVLPEEPLGALGFLRTPTDEVMIGFWPDAAPRNPDATPPLHAGLMSDGTLRYLAILTAIETLDAGTMLLIEDFDAGLHPSRIERLVQRLWTRCEERGVKALVTTHNPAVLNALQGEQLSGVVICYRDTDFHCGRLCPLLDVPDVDILLERGQLGDIVTRQILARHLMPKFSKDRQA